MGTVTLSAYAFSQTLSYQRSENGTSSLNIDLSYAREDIIAGGVNISLSPQSRQTDGEKALSTLTKLAADAKLYPKQAAKQKLDAAIKQLQIIKLLGSLKGAKALVQLAKQINSAAQDYAGAEQDLADQGAAAADPVSDPASGTAAPSDKTAAPAVRASQQQDPFFTDAEQALGEIRKALRKILPAEEASSDRKTREAARKLHHDFNQAVTDTLSAETAFNAAEPAAAAYEDAEGLTASDPSSGTASSSQAPVDLII